MFVYVLFCQHLAVTERGEDAIEELKIRIGERLRLLRESRGDTQRDVARRIDPNKENPNHALVSRLESGTANPELSNLLEVIVIGLQTDFAEFCRHFSAEDPERERDERTARELLEKAFRRGRKSRKSAIDALRVLTDEPGGPKGKRVK